MTTKVTNTTSNKADYATYPQRGIGYQLYTKQMAEDIAPNANLKIKGYINLNERRMHRVEKTCVAGEAIT